MGRIAVLFKNPVLFIISLFFCQPPHASAIPVTDGPPVTITGESLSFKEILSRIEKQTGYSFAYSNSIFDKWEKKDVSVEGLPLEKALEAIFKDSGYACRIVRRHIIISAAPKRIPLPKPPKPVEKKKLQLVIMPGSMSDSTFMSRDTLTVMRVMTLDRNSTWDYHTPGALVYIPPEIIRPEPRKPFEFRIKTNLLYLATSTLNLAAEARVAEHWTAGLSLGWNPWDFGSGRKLKHFSARPEVRYWPRKAFDGYFIGFDLLYCDYDIGRVNFLSGIKDRRYDGNMFGFGFSGGYAMDLNSKLGLEFMAGVGLANLKFDKYDWNDGVYELLRSDREKAFVTARLGVSLVYRIK